MSKLSEYIEKIKKYKEEHPELTELELIRYVYIDLGRMFSFDENAYFGNIMKSRKLFNKVKNRDDSILEEIMEKQIGMCKDISYISEKVLSELGIDISTVKDIGDDYHVHNLIRVRDEKGDLLIFTIDIQKDIPFIKNKMKTQYFGLKRKYVKENVFSESEMRNMDENIEYIGKGEEYTDKYYEELKQKADKIERLGEKTDFVFKNLFKVKNTKLRYFDRRYFIEYIKEMMFSKKERRNITTIDGYYEENGERKYQTCIAINNHGESEIYRFSEEKQEFYKENIDEFAQEVNNGLVCNKRVIGLRNALKRLKEKNEKEESFDENSER